MHAFRTLNTQQNSSTKHTQLSSIVMSSKNINTQIIIGLQLQIFTDWNEKYCNLTNLSGCNKIPIFGEPQASDSFLTWVENE